MTKCRSRKIKRHWHATFQLSVITVTLPILIHTLRYMLLVLKEFVKLRACERCLPAHHLHQNRHRTASQETAHTCTASRTACASIASHPLTQETLSRWCLHHPSRCLLFSINVLVLTSQPNAASGSSLHTDAPVPTN